jgi:hypothetical protein
MNWKRFLHYEFWPYWVFYIPAYFYYFYLAIKLKRWVYFSVLNPCMKFGGAFLSSKHNYLKKIPAEWTPKTLYISDFNSLETLNSQLEDNNLTFPLIAKPDMGERGRNVELIATLKALEQYLETINQPVLLQEYIDYPIEIGILFYWDSDRNPHITSVGAKEFCKLTGDGIRTLETLVKDNHRISHRKAILKKRFKTQWHQIIPKGKQLLVEPIGNHNRGTTFLDAREHKSKEMLDWIKKCLEHLSDFDYGRIDLKIESWEAFKNNKGLKILEINGVNYEPIHIYDPSCSIWSAYASIFEHMHIIYTLSKNKLNTQSQTPSLFEFISGARVVLCKKGTPQISYS